MTKKEEKINQTDNLIKRLSRLEGQLGGIRKMISDKRACNDIITQVMAVREAMSSLGVEIIKNDLVCNKNSKGMDEAYLKSLFKIK